MIKKTGRAEALPQINNRNGRRKEGSAAYEVRKEGRE